MLNQEGLDGISDGWEEDVCRICRGPGEEGSPLYHPCACSGSIQYVHQNCLTTWLEHSKKNKCEVCKHTFRFTPIFIEDAPSIVPARVMVLGLLVKALRGAKYLSRIVLGSFVWMIVVPLSTCWMGRLAFVRSMDEVKHLVNARAKTSHAVADSVQGILMCTAIVVTFLSVTTLREYVTQVLAEEWMRHRNPRHMDPWDTDQRSDDEMVQTLLQELARGPGENGTRWLRFLPVSRTEISDTPGYETIVFHRNNGIVDTILELLDFDSAGATELRAERPINGTAIHSFFIYEGTRAFAVSPSRVHELLTEHYSDISHGPNDVDDQVDDINATNWDHGLDNIEEVPLRELIGLEGPVHRLFENALAVMISNLVFLFVTVSIPYHVGKFSVALCIKSLNFLAFCTSLAGHTGQIVSTEASTLSSAISKTLDAQSHVLVLLLGYATAVVNLVSWKYLLSWFLYMSREYLHVTRRPERQTNLLIALARGFSIVGQWIGDVLGFVLVMIKVIGLLSVELGVLPVACGWWLSFCCRPALGDLATNVVNGSIFRSSPLVACVLLWLTGLVFMLHIGTFATALREVLRPNILPWLRDPASDPEFHPLRELVKEPIRRHLRRLALASLLYAKFALLGLFVPIQLLSKLPWRVFPLHLKFTDPLTEIPVNMLLIHLCFPLLSAGRVNPRRIAVHSLRSWLGAVGSLLNLSTLLMEPSQDEGRVSVEQPSIVSDWGEDAADEEENKPLVAAALSVEETEATPPFLGLRVSALLVLSWLACSVVSASLMVLPTVCGRVTFRFLNLPNQNDLNAFCMGCYAAWGSLIAMQAAVGFIWTHAPSDAFKLVCHKIRGLVVLIYFGWMWLVVIPFLVGLLVRKAIVIPLGLGNIQEYDTLHLPQIWAGGLLMLKTWHHLVMALPREWSFLVGMDDESLQIWRTRFYDMGQRGALQLEFTKTAKEIFIPVLSVILRALLLPQLSAEYIFPHLIRMFASPQKCASLMIYIDTWVWCYFIGVYAVLHVLNLLLRWAVLIHDNIREEHYIVGHKLDNFERPPRGMENSSNLEASDSHAMREPANEHPVQPRYNLRRRPARRQPS